MYEITIRLSFAASHLLVGYEGDCGRLHGHNWDVLVSCARPELDDLGMVMDFREAKKILSSVIAQLDHTHLNDHPAFAEENPSTENIARFIFQSLKAQLGVRADFVNKVTVFESRNNSASYWE